MTPPSIMAHDPDRAADLFARVLEQAPADRDAFLHRETGTDVDLRAEVSSLLAAHVAGDARLDPPSARDLAALLHEPTFGLRSNDQPERIGAYQLEHELGRGGMGVVYAARRTAGGFDQQVAIKLIKPVVSSEAITQRFLAERQMLAQLTHPSIARLLDGGSTDEGMPYFAMELIDGEPVDAYCDRASFDTAARLRLFLEAAHAVAYAHRRLIVHRDLKPTNILVTKGGGVKLLDFGIAKWLGDERGGIETHTNTLAITPAYAAPEQVLGETVTTAVDVYALGAVLYELLTGKRANDDVSTPVQAIKKAMRNDPPPMPSAAVADDSSRARLLRGDLDAIVQKALRAEPEQRYSSVEALADDVERHLAGLPVAARGDSLRYRTLTFVRRHRSAMAAAALILVSLVGGLVATAWQARRAAAERDRAQHEAESAEAVKHFVVSLFEAADPAEARGEPLTADILLERGVERVDAALDTAPPLRAEMLATLGNVYRALGRVEPSRALLERANDLASAHLTDRDPDRVDMLISLADTLHAAGEREPAAAMYEEALTRYQAIFGTRHARVATSLDQIAVIRNELGDYDGARSRYEEALAIRRELHGDEHPDVATTLANLAALAWELADYPTADARFREVLALRRKLLGEDHPDVAHAMANLSVMRMELGDYAESAALAETSLALQRKIYPDGHPAIARNLGRLAALALHRGAFDAAEALGRQAVDLEVELLGADHPSLAISRINLGRALAELGRFEEAEMVIGHASAQLAASFPPEHSVQAAPLHIRIHMLCLRGRGAEAEPLVERALAIHRTAVGDDHPRVRAALTYRATILADTARWPESESVWRQILAAQRAHLATDHPKLAASLIGLGSVLVAQGRAGEAESLAREALRLRQQMDGADPWLVAEAESLLGAALRERSSSRAAALLRRSHASLLERRGVWHPATIRAASWLVANG